MFIGGNSQKESRYLSSPVYRCLVWWIQDWLQFQSIHPSIRPSIRPSVHPSIHPSINFIYPRIYRVALKWLATLCLLFLRLKIRQQMPSKYRLLFKTLLAFHCLIDATAINNGNRTELSPIQSVIIRVINKIGRPRSGSLIC